MSARLDCPYCKIGFRTSAQAPVGKKVRCPKCQKVFQVPEGGELEETPPKSRAKVPNEELSQPKSRPPRKSRDDDDDPADCKGELCPKRKKKQGSKGLMIAMLAGGANHRRRVGRVSLKLSSSVGWIFSAHAGRTRVPTVVESEAPTDGKANRAETDIGGGALLEGEMVACQANPFTRRLTKSLGVASSWHVGALPLRGSRIFCPRRRNAITGRPSKS